MKKKKRTKEKNVLRLTIDRFFSESRKNILENSFQDMHEAHLEIYKKYDVPYVLTTQPKREYIKGEKLIDKGFRIYYQFENQEQYDLFKTVLFERFKNDFYLKQRNYDLEKKHKILFAGYYQITNKKKEDTNEIRK